MNDCINKDWSKHELTVIEKDIGLSQPLIIHDLHISGTRAYSVRFTNIHDKLLVDGDYGHWSFCIRFVPSADNPTFCIHYMAEKLNISHARCDCGGRIGYKIDWEATKAQLVEFLEENEIADNYNYENLDNAIRDQSFFEYTAALHDLDSHDDAEALTPLYHPDYWLEVVYSAYCEICKRLKINGGEA